MTRNYLSASNSLSAQRHTHLTSSPPPDLPELPELPDTSDDFQLGPHPSLTRSHFDLNLWTCLECDRTFAKQYQLKYVPWSTTFSQLIFCSKHSLAHTRPFKCPDPSCDGLGFPSPKDLDRHRKARHAETGSTSLRHWCPVKECKYSAEGGKGFARLDHFESHIAKTHSEFSLSSMESNRMEELRGGLVIPIARIRLCPHECHACVGRMTAARFHT